MNAVDVQIKNVLIGFYGNWSITKARNMLDCMSEMYWLNGAVTQTNIIHMDEDINNVHYVSNEIRFGCND